MRIPLAEFHLIRRNPGYFLRLPLVSERGSWTRYPSPLGSHGIISKPRVGFHLQKFHECFAIQTATNEPVVVNS